MVNRPYTVALIIPTGIGASVGGYAGDALPVARALSQVCDRLITHPNVLNGAQLYWPIANALYVEGYALDQFAAGQWGLQPVHQNRIGLVLDAAIEPELRWRHLQVADAARATLGLELTDYVVTDQPLGVELRTAPSGATWGTIQAPDSLLRAAHRLIHEVKADAIAVIARFPDDPGAEALQNYRHGQGVDPLAGAEAVISHLVVRQFRIPCAHAPALEPLPLDPSLSPKSAAEEIGYTFLPCVLAGLSRAPQLVDRSQIASSAVTGSLAESIWRDQLDALIVPETACGGSATLHLSQARTKIITVRENSTRMQACPKSLGLKTLSVQSYLEAIGAIAAHRAGVSPTALSSSIPSLQEILPPLRLV
ncbi:DUF3326 domain-containing protein [Alkalinema pantanalense CENA528]|uniref:DUF3326 domain-containing protein n=1 Tax=Alkalinema pantanalense TaxID=1620705 RepID=UPI003D6DF674